jgi:hypothetical protein
MPRKKIKSPIVPDDVAPTQPYGLCFRCEHRARFVEFNARFPNSTQAPRPRYECGEPNASKHSCYMYQPVRPVILAADTGDKRPQLGPAMIAARMHALGFPAEIKLAAIQYRDGVLPFWLPDAVKRRSNGRRKQARRGKTPAHR